MTPCFVYRSPGAISRARYTYDSVLVSTEQQMTSRLSAGWFKTLAEAVEAAGKRAAPVRKLPKKPPRKPSKPIDGINRRVLQTVAAPEPAPVPEPVEDVSNDDAPPTRTELEQQATLLGIKFDGRTTDKRLLERINEAMKGA